MALSAKLQVRQTQSLVMTPQLLQSIRLLQYTATELEQFIAQEIERNPILEREESQEQGISADEPVEDNGADEWIRQDLEWSASQIAGKMDTTLENVFPDDPGIRESVSPALEANWRSAPGTTSSVGQEPFDLDQVSAAPLTLGAHIREQIALMIRNPADRLIAAELADAVDPNGWFSGDCQEIAERLAIPVSRVSGVLEACQAFDPPGLFGCSLAECLALQLKAKDRLDPAMQIMLDNLDLLARRDFPSLKRLCNVDEEDLLDMLAEIRALDPRPGTSFEAVIADPVIADVIVSKAADGSWNIELNPETLPRVLVNETYAANVQAGARSEEDREFITECLHNAHWLTRSLDQRARTILKVASEIVRQQDAFLEHGVSHMRPLTLRGVAEVIGMHESTVSRATANKFMMTPRGIVEMRHFFSAALPSAAGGDAHAAESVRHRIRQLIDAETAANILSDDAIVAKLHKAGIDVARRTVAKYREGMNIPSSVQRRREKKALQKAMA